MQHTIEKTVILSEEGKLQIHNFDLNRSDRTTAEPDGMTLEEAEKALIQSAMKRNRDNLSAVATELGITRPTLYSKMKKYLLT